MHGAIVFTTVQDWHEEVAHVIQDLKFSVRVRKDVLAVLQELMLLPEVEFQRMQWKGPSGSAGKMDGNATLHALVQQRSPDCYAGRAC